MNATEATEAQDSAAKLAGYMDGVREAARVIENTNIPPYKKTIMLEALKRAAENHIEWSKNRLAD